MKNFQPWKIFYLKNVSTLKIFQLWKIFNFEKFSTLKTFQPWKIFYLKNFSTLKIFQPWKILNFEKFSTLKNFQIWKIFIFEKFTTLKNFQLCILNSFWDTEIKQKMKDLEIRLLFLLVTKIKTIPSYNSSNYLSNNLSPNSASLTVFKIM